MFYKKVSQYLQEKKPVLESVFNKMTAINAFFEYCKIFKNTYFSENLRTAASEHFFFEVDYQIITYVKLKKQQKKLHN